MGPTLEELMLDARRKAEAEGALPKPRPSSAGGPGPLVQLAVRVPAGLRADVRAAAERRGTSVQAFVHAALEQAVDEVFNPLAAVRAAWVADAQAHILAAFESGAWQEAQDAFDEDDPDMAIR